MSPRIKKLLGFFLLLPAITLYFFAAAALGERVPNNQLLEALYFLIAGVAWAYPAKFAISWMNADPKRDTPPPSS